MNNRKHKRQKLAHRQRFIDRGNENRRVLKWVRKVLDCALTDYRRDPGGEMISLMQQRERLLANVPKWAAGPAEECRPVMPLDHIVITINPFAAKGGPLWQSWEGD
jgi:hypothetical protein